MHAVRKQPRRRSSIDREVRCTVKLQQAAALAAQAMRLLGIEGLPAVDAPLCR